ncbi:uncharacterized protein N7511_008146 [Penicillium nucicola]|uniref:uncharacterized protein n=1 Tax=Penicillium nucicola TaxID=1850975 RepID=UPI002544DCA6|nr:uncharacterized protein N7511_008146 [Penicillium nucicola]KAJ5753993.1 hypothetical protein N7511_008146 [Penicillium nucicola]
MTSASRQQPGLACEECRKRKLRCDRQQPRCDQCEDSGAICYVNQDRSPRGPKRGHLKALRSRIATLESMVNRDQLSYDLNAQYTPKAEVGQFPTPPGSTSDGTRECRSLSRSVEETPPSNASCAPSIALELEISGIIEADLDQLYFDRVHPVAPMLHQGRYLAWSQQCQKIEPYAGLQAAMWALAAAATAHLQHMRDSLYLCARSKLEALDSQIEYASSASLQSAQGWLLLTHYEFRYMNYSRAWITAGRAFRIIQLMKLHELDRYHTTALDLAFTEPWAEVEEKRRTFWLAYCLDRFLNISDQWPLTLHEDPIWIFLPAPESDFQHGRPVLMGSISDAIETSGQNALPPFAEAVVLTTLCWHGVSLKRTPPATKPPGLDPGIDLWEHHHRLYQVAQQRLMLLSLPPCSLELLDPMRLFVNMLANSAIIWFYGMMEVFRGISNDQSILVPLYSAYEVASLAKPLIRSGFFTVSMTSSLQVPLWLVHISHALNIQAHAFSPMLLFLAAKFLQTHGDQLGLSGSVAEDQYNRLDELKRALMVLQNGNNLAMNYLDLLESDWFDRLGGFVSVQGDLSGGNGAAGVTLCFGYNESLLSDAGRW